MPMIQSLMNEGIAPREPDEQILILNIIHWNMQMLETSSKWVILFELPFQYRYDVRDVAIA